MSTEKKEAEEIDAKMAQDLGISVTSVIRYRRGSEKENDDPFGAGIVED